MRYSKVMLKSEALSIMLLIKGVESGGRKSILSKGKGIER